MIALLQRVSKACVEVDGRPEGTIGSGLLVFIGIRPDDTPITARVLIDRILRYRVFADDRGKMNLNLMEIGGGLLLVPQFTLAANTTRGLRPGFSTAASPGIARPLFEGAVEYARSRYAHVQTGVFGAHMQVGLVNDGPVTFWLES